MKISIVELQKNFGLQTALEDVNLVIEPGQAVAVLGANGAGKTTLLQCLAGITLPSAGTIYYDDQRFTRENLELRKHFHFLPDFPAVFPDTKVIDHIRIVVQMYRSDSDQQRQRILDLMDEFDLLEMAETKMASLSRGQTYKAALTALIVADPDVWMLDEPFASGMDPHGLFTFRHEAEAAVARGRTLIYTTQILDVVERFSDQVCVLHNGVLRACAPLSELHQSQSSNALEAVFRELRDEHRAEILENE